MMGNRVTCLLFWVAFFFVAVLQRFVTDSQALVKRQLTHEDHSGFINIDCGLGGGSYYDTVNDISYTSDEKYISTGENRGISPEFYSELREDIYKTVRSFPEGRRNCYNLWPLIPNSKYMIRAQFMYGNYDGNNKIPGFDVYIGVNLWFTISLASVDYRAFKEIIHVANTDSIDVCLVNTGQGTPFVSVLVLQLLDNSSYPASPQSSLYLRSREDIGCKTKTGSYYVVEDDAYGRMWYRSPQWTNWTTVSTNKSIDDSQAKTLKVPTSVLNTAAVPNYNIASVAVKSNFPTNQVYAYWHFAELELHGSNDTREFNIFVPHGQGYTFGPISPKYMQLTTISSPLISLNGSDVFKYTLMKTARSNLYPIFNAFELFNVLHLLALPTTKMMDKYEQIIWQGDPCLPVGYQWEGLSCSYDDNNPPRITSLNLSTSNLIGELPLSLSNLTALKYLNLSNNGFTGTIPDFLAYLPSLNVIDLTRNNLTGPVPLELLRKATNNSIDLRLEGNYDVCKTYPCKEQTKADKRRYHFVIPMLISVALVVLLVIISIIFLAFRERKKQDVSGSRVIIPKNKQFNSSDILRITDNFKQILGRGGFGTVYHGLHDGTEVAVKVLHNSSSTITMKQFCAEAELLTRIHHVNLVSLIGYCDKPATMALVYEYMLCGNLQMHLSETNEHPLSWKSRLQISIDAAQGLEYLHSGCRPPIIHRDIKPANILLDEMGHAKIADFGLSRFFTTNSQDPDTWTDLAGTRGYLDPECCQLINILRETSDVYAFGVVLLQLLTGKPALIKQTEDDNDPIHIVEQVSPMVQSGDILAIADKSLHGDLDINSTWKFLEIAMECVKPTGDQRPRMSEVVADLKHCCASDEIHEHTIEVGVDDSNINMNLNQELDNNLVSLPTAR